MDMTSNSPPSLQVREVLGMSEQLHGTLSTLTKEKDLLATSLRQEATYTRQLEEEKVDSNVPLPAIVEVI